jgi:hypothetical protein
MTYVFLWKDNLILKTKVIVFFSADSQKKDYEGEIQIQIQIHEIYTT